jgi:hypothetical protein
MNEMQRIQEHVRMCPLGWHNGAVRTTRSTTDADIIAWLARLRVLVGLDPASGGVEHD